MDQQWRFKRGRAHNLQQHTAEREREKQRPRPDRPVGDVITDRLVPGAPGNLGALCPVELVRVVEAVGPEYAGYSEAISATLLNVSSYLLRGPCGPKAYANWPASATALVLQRRHLGALDRVDHLFAGETTAGSAANSKDKTTRNDKTPLPD